MHAIQMRPRELASRLVVVAIDNSLLLLVGAVCGLVWANAGPSSYTALAHRLHFPVNKVGMVFFFGIATKEIVEATLPGGPLGSLRRAALPLLAALGGMAVPALLYVTLCLWMNVPELIHGWAIPCATDIAFSYLVARIIFGARHPAIPLLLLLAIVDDALGLVILAAFYPAGEFRLTEFLAIGAAAVGMAWTLRLRGVRSFWPYVGIAGSLAWIAFYRGGIHPSLALVPIVPFLPHAARGERDLGLSNPHDDDPDALNRFEGWWRMPVQVVLFFFGLANAGVPFTGVGVGTWAVLVALVLGKPAGILIFSVLSAQAGLERPRGVTWRDMAVAANAAGIGFTVSLFFATAAFAEGVSLDQTKMGALLSFSAAGLAVAGALGLRVGRFGRHEL
jgi:NhaA family Na+:H+ antiporter